MLPVLLDLKFVKIYTFGVFLVLAFFWGSFLLWKNIRLTSFKEEDIFDGLFLALTGGLFGGRLLYVILNFREFGFDFLKFILINGYPGMSFYGALIGAIGVLSLYLFYKKIRLREVVDYLIGPAFIALAFGKLGSFFSGVEVGSVTQLPLSIKYVGFEGFRHLTPLYEGLLFFIALTVAQKLLFDIRREKYLPGFLFFFFLWYTAATYFLFDKLKVNRLYLIGQSFNGLVSLVVLLITSFYFIYYFRSSIILYGQKTYQKIYQRAKRAFRGRAGKSHQAD